MTTAEAGIRKSDETVNKNRLIWVCGDNDNVREQVRELARSEAMVKKYRPRRENLSIQKRLFSTLFWIIFPFVAQVGTFDPLIGVYCRSSSRSCAAEKSSGYTTVLP